MTSSAFEHAMCCRINRIIIFNSADMSLENQMICILETSIAGSLDDLECFGHRPMRWVRRGGE